MPSLKETLARLFGGSAQPQPSPQEAELRRILQEGDDLRRARQADAALDKYQEGLSQARTEGLAHIQEVFLGQLGALYTDLGKYAEAEEAFVEAIALSQRGDQLYRQARAQLNYGTYHLKRNQLPKALDTLEEALELGRKGHDQATVSLALGNLAEVHMRQGNPAYALRLLKEVLPQAMTSTQHATYIIGRMGQSHLALGEVERGRKLLAQAIRLAEQYHQPEQELLWATLLAKHMYLEGHVREALAFYNRAADLTHEVMSLPIEYNSLENLLHRASLYQQTGNLAEAHQLAQEAAGLARSEGNPEAEAESLITLGKIQRGEKQRDKAVESLQTALGLLNESSPARAQALVTLGTIYQDQGDYDKALEIFEQTLQIAGSDPREREGRAQALVRIGGLLQKQGNLSAALEKLTEAVSLFETANDHDHAARTLCDVGNLRRQLSGINAAMSDYERATMLLSNAKDDNTRGVVMSNVAAIYTDLGEADTARSFYTQAIELSRKAGNRRAESLRLGNFGWFHIMIGKPRDGATLIEAALSISRDLGDPLLIAVQENNLGLAHHDLRDYAAAERCFKQALDGLSGDHHEKARWEAIFKANLARTYLATGRVSEATELLEAALPVSRTHHDGESVARALTRLAEAYILQERVAEADKLSEEAERIARKLGYRKGHADALWIRAKVAANRGDQAAQTEALKEARRWYKILGDPLEAEAAKLLGETA